MGISEFAGISRGKSGDGPGRSFGCGSGDSFDSTGWCTGCGDSRGKSYGCGLGDGYGWGEGSGKCLVDGSERGWCDDWGDVFGFGYGTGSCP